MSSFFLADDLSGALDAGGAFHRRGLEVEIAVNAGGVGRALARSDGGLKPALLGVTTETRNMPATFAAAAVEKVLASAREAGASLVFKKIDSTLRGPVAAELRAVMNAFPQHRVLFAPANPAVGRTVENGVLRVKGVPLAETDFARDPLNPMRSSAVTDILGDVATERVTIPDIRTEADLASVVEWMNARAEPWIAVGSGALARFVRVERDQAVAGSAALKHSERQDRAIPPYTKHPVLMIAGSAHPLNLTQVEMLRAQRGAQWHEIDFSAPTEVAADIATTLDRGLAAIVGLPPKRVDPVAALRAITAAVVAVLQTSAVERVFATGGETAYALCEALGVERLQFVEEIEPGVTLAAGASTRGQLLLGVKPGGFGDALTWVRAYDRMSA